MSAPPLISMVMGEQKSGISGALVTIIALATFLVGGIGGFGVGCAVGSIGSTASPSRSSDTGSRYSLPSTSAVPTAPAVAPKPDDFFIEVIVTEQQCFGSAGCNYQLSINPTYIGSADLSGDWKVVYELTGGDDPQMGNFTIEGDNIRWDSEKMIQGSSGATFKAVVTSIVKSY